MKRLLVCILTVVMLFAAVSVCGETDFVSGDVIDFGECVLVYKVEKQSETGLRIYVLTADGTKKQFSAVGGIKVKTLGLVNATYTVQAENEYDFSQNQLEAALIKLNTLYGDKHKPYIAGVALDSTGHVESVYIPGGNLPADVYESYFATVASGYWIFNKGGTVAMPNAAGQSYQLQDNAVVYGYNYDFTDLQIQKVEQNELVGKTFTGTIYSLTGNKKAEVLLITLPSEQYTPGVIETISPAKNSSGGDVYKITLLKDGKTVTKYTQNKSIIDKYEFYADGTEYSVKIASGFYPGAVVYFRENEKGEIARIEKLYPIASETGKMSDAVPYYKSEVFTTYNSTPVVYWYGDNCEIFVAYGKVTRASTAEKKITMASKYLAWTNSGAVYETNYDYSTAYDSAKILVVDYSDDVKVRAGGEADIEKGDYVLVCKAWGEIENIVVYKDFRPDNFVNLIPVNSVALDKTELSLNVGNMDVLKATVNPSNAISKKIVWSTSDEDVAVVEEGNVTAVGTGNAVITATSYEGGKIAECKVTVMEKQKMSISDVTVENGTEFSVNLSPEPKGRVIAALYDKSGNIAEVKTVLPAQTKVDFEFSGVGSRVKVIWIDSALRPYTEPIEQAI